LFHETHISIVLYCFKVGTFSTAELIFPIYFGIGLKTFKARLEGEGTGMEIVYTKF
jgi:hypothetical protein